MQTVLWITLFVVGVVAIATALRSRSQNPTPRDVGYGDIWDTIPEMFRDMAARGPRPHHESQNGAAVSGLAAQRAAAVRHLMALGTVEIVGTNFSCTVTLANVCPDYVYTEAFADESLKRQERYAGKIEKYVNW